MLTRPRRDRLSKSACPLLVRCLILSVNPRYALSINMAVIREKEILKEVLIKYRELTVLWDPTHEMYGNKLVRKEGYQRLLEIYKKCDPDINLYEFKRKLENMRTTYRRERLKVLKYRKKGEEYVPVLWYYNLFTFLNHLQYLPNPNRPEPYFLRDKKSLHRSEIIQALDSTKTECLSESPPPKKNKKSNIIFLTEDAIADQEVEDVHTEDQSYTVDDQTSFHNVGSSTVLFGKTVGLQLRELKSLQRYISEKLISDVIFHGRLGQLRPESKLSFDKV